MLIFKNEIYHFREVEWGLEVTFAPPGPSVIPFQLPKPPPPRLGADPAPRRPHPSLTAASCPLLLRFTPESSRRRAPMTEDRAHKVTDEPAAVGRQRPERYPAPSFPRSPIRHGFTVDCENYYSAPARRPCG